MLIACFYRIKVQVLILLFRSTGAGENITTTSDTK